MNIGTLLIIYLINAERIPIITYNTGIYFKKITTGNGNINNVDWSLLFTEPKSTMEIIVDKDIKEGVEYFSSIKNNLIVDLSNEDPKVFLPTNNDYYYVASKRGYVFNLFAIIFMVFLFWLFVIRIAHGDCGGYKTITKKPEKKDRYIIHIITLSGYAIFITSYLISSYYMYSDRKLLKMAGDSLKSRNKMQKQLYEYSKKRIKNINNKNYDVIYSNTSFEKLKIGLFTEGFKDIFDSSIENAKKINDDFFLGFSNMNYLRMLIVLLVVHACLFSFFFIYIKRKMTFSLILTFLLGILIVFASNSISQTFNYWTIIVEMCEQTIDVFNNGKPAIEFRPFNKLESIFTCLDTNSKHKLKEELVSLLTAQNTIRIILKNYFETEDYEIFMGEYLDSVENILKYKDFILEKIKHHKDSTIPFSHKKNILNLVSEIDSIFLDLKKIDSCENLKIWANDFNDSVCKIGLWYEFYQMFLLGLMIIGILVMALGIFLSENVIQGLYKEEIQYVKTSKLRYDWN